MYFINTELAKEPTTPDGTNEEVTLRGFVSSAKVALVEPDI